MRTHSRLTSSNLLRVAGATKPHTTIRLHSIAQDQFAERTQVRSDFLRILRLSRMAGHISVAPLKSRFSLCNTAVEKLTNADRLILYRGCKLSQHTGIAPGEPPLVMPNQQHNITTFNCKLLIMHEYWCTYTKIITEHHSFLYKYSALLKHMPLHQSNAYGHANNNYLVSDIHSLSSCNYLHDCTAIWPHAVL